MPVFQYKARGADGSLKQGETEANSVAQVARELQGQKLIPLEISEAKPAGWLSKELQFGNKVKREDIILLTRQLFALTKSGVPIIRGMGLLIASIKNKRLQEVLAEIIEDLQAGRELAVALAKFPDIFSNVYINMISVGEQTGHLDTAFERLYAYLQMEDKTVKQIKSAVRYPIMVVVSIFSAIAYLMIKVIPKFVSIFGQYDLELPWATKVLIAFSDFMVAWWPYLFSAIGAAVFAFLSWIKTAKGKLWWDEFKVKMPIFGSIIQRATLARFSRAFAMAYGAGVPILQSLSMLALAVDNDYIGNKVNSMKAGIERGDSLSNTAIQTNVFTPLVLQMIAVGEESGQLDKMLQEVAEFYEAEVSYDVDHIADLIQPILTFVIGLMVLVLALGIFMPMFNLTQIAH